MGERIVLDTNVLVSALGWRGAPYEIVRRCHAGEHRLLISPEILSELERVLRYPKLKLTADRIDAYLEQLTELVELIRPAIEISAITADASDNRILECALAGRADIIVSGDSHLLDLRTFEGISILRRQEFLNWPGRID